ncbi:DUF2158 domain-containing protein [Pseudomonas fluorescens]|uniref:DUF2158 domain-containing protein n=1 Tax=Pseudomonas fluorescens TaxID=294 RepID=UPI003747A6F9
MASQKIAKGTLLKLTAGGPDMAVKRLITNQQEVTVQVECQWFAGKKLEQGIFPVESLEIVTKAKK